MKVILHPAYGMNIDIQLSTNALNVSPQFGSKFTLNGFVPAFRAEHHMHHVLRVGMGHVPHLRCSAFLYLPLAALTRWAKVCRASGARTRPSRHGAEGGHGRRAALHAERREGTAFRLLPGIYDAMPLHGWEQRAELAGGEVFRGTEASVEFGGRQAPQAVDSAEKIPGRTVALARVAFETAGNQVAVGIASEPRAWHDVVEALHVSGSAAEAVKAGAAFAIVNGFAERPGFQEIRGFEGGGGRLFRGLGGAILARADGADLLGQAHLDNVAGFAAFEQAQSSELIEAAHRLAHRSVGQTEIAGYGHNRKVQAELAYDEGMAQQIRVDGAVPDGQAETRGENIFKLHPEEFGVQS